MKKKLPLSPVACVLLLLLLVVAVYALVYYPKAQSEVLALRTDVMLNESQVQLYEQYLADSTPLQKEIDALQKEIDKLHSEGYVNESNVSLAISDAVQRYSISLTSVTLSSVTTYKNFRALPINLSIYGDLENVRQFIQHFESNQDGSYVVRGVNMDISAYSAEAAIVIYLCTPSV